MSTVVKTLTISESEARKALDDAINKELSKKICVDLLPTDWTIERLVDRGMSATQAHETINKMIKEGLAIEIRYRRDNKYYAKGCRAIVKE